MSTVLAVCFGPFFPMLYPATLFLLVVTYTYQRLCLCYWYREPRILGRRIAVYSLRLLNVFVFVALFAVFWEMGNRQILENHVVPLKFRNQAEPSGHFLLQTLRNMRVKDPCFLPVLVFVIILLFQII